MLFLASVQFASMLKYSTKTQTSIEIDSCINKYITHEHFEELKVDMKPAHKESFMLDKS